MHGGAAHGLDAEPARERDRVAHHLDVVRGALELDATVLAARHGEALDGDPRLPRDVEAVGPVADARRMQGGSVAAHVHVQPRAGHVGEAAGRQRVGCRGGGGQARTVREHLSRRPGHARRLPHADARRHPQQGIRVVFGPVHDHGPVRGAGGLDHDRAAGESRCRQAHLLRVHTRLHLDRGASGVVRGERRRDRAVGRRGGAGSGGRGHGVRVVHDVGLGPAGARSEEQAAGHQRGEERATTPGMAGDRGRGQVRCREQGSGVHRWGLSSVDPGHGAARAHRRIANLPVRAPSGDWMR